MQYDSVVGPAAEWIGRCVRGAGRAALAAALVGGGLAAAADEAASDKAEAAEAESDPVFPELPKQLQAAVEGLVRSSLANLDEDPAMPGTYALTFEVAGLSGPVMVTVADEARYQAAASNNSVQSDDEGQREQFYDLNLVGSATPASGGQLLVTFQGTFQGRRTRSADGEVVERSEGSMAVSGSVRCRPGERRVLARNGDFALTMALEADPGESDAQPADDAQE